MTEIKLNVIKKYECSICHIKKPRECVEAVIPIPFSLARNGFPIVCKKCLKDKNFAGNYNDCEETREKLKPGEVAEKNGI